MKIADIDEEYETKRMLAIITAATLNGAQRSAYLAAKVGLSLDHFRKNKLPLWVEKGYIKRIKTLGGVTMYRSKLEL